MHQQFVAVNGVKSNPTGISCGIPQGSVLGPILFYYKLSNDLGKVDSNFFCYAAMVLSPHRNVLIFTQRMHKPTWR